jgi:hypothetical protein
MCGKFTRMFSRKEVHDYSDFLRPTDGEVATEDLSNRPCVEQREERCP